jgi:hypothetical protein
VTVFNKTYTELTPRQETPTAQILIPYHPVTTWRLRETVAGPTRMSGQSNDGGNRTENTELSKAIFW